MSTDDSINFVICEPESLLRYSLATLIRKHNSTGCVMNVTNLEEAHAILKPTSAHCCLVVDPFIDFDGTKKLLATYPMLYTIAYTKFTSDIYRSICHSINIKAIVSKFEPVDILRESLISVVNGHVFEKNLDDVESIGTPLLSKRERTVLSLLIKGDRNKAIARKLNLSDKTISTYKSRILKKCNIDSIMDLAITDGLGDALMQTSSNY